MLAPLMDGHPGSTLGYTIETLNLEGQATRLP
jgi:hypothetical protein